MLKMLLSTTRIKLLVFNHFKELDLASIAEALAIVIFRSSKNLALWPLFMFGEVVEQRRPQLQ